MGTIPFAYSAFDVLLHLDLQKSVGEGGRHRDRDRAVFRPVARRADVPPVRNLVELAEPPVENELVGGDLQ